MAPSYRFSGFVASGQINLQRIDGCRKTATEAERDHTVNTAVVVTAGVVLAVSGMAGPVFADAQESNPPTFTRGKFAVPVNRDAVAADWAARGYAHLAVKPYGQGRSRAEHTHPVSLVITVVTGRIEFLIAGQQLCGRTAR